MTSLRWLGEPISEGGVTITVPVLFHVQWDDELFPRDGQFEFSTYWAPLTSDSWRSRPA